MQRYKNISVMISVDVRGFLFTTSINDIEERCVYRTVYLESTCRSSTSQISMAAQIQRSMWLLSATSVIIKLPSPICVRLVFFNSEKQVLQTEPKLFSGKVTL